MKRYLLRLSYIGTNYRGSQKHSNGNVLDVDSIQGSIESTLYKYLRHLNRFPTVTLAGRTDAGVHALCTTAHFDLDHKSGDTQFSSEGLIQCMNQNLIYSGHEIRIFSCHEVSTDFHARFSAKSRTYLYRFLLTKDPNNLKCPIAEMNRTLHINKYKYQEAFDIERMKKGLKLFNGRKDFTTFSAKSLRDKNRPDLEYKRSFVRDMCAIMEETQPLMPFDPLSKNFNYWNIIFTSKSFLYNQIRRMVGALIALGVNRLTEEDIITMLQVPSHHNWPSKATPAPPHGLYLLNVEYDPELTKEICS